MKKYILFDLDGTLTDPKVGITTCVQYALKDFGIDEPNPDNLEPFIGPPLKDSFIKYYNMTDEQADKAVEKYRERFRDKGLFENELYGGIHDLLRTLKAGGLRLAVASSKPTVFVERILKHFKLDKYFEVVVGSELDGKRVEKAQVIQEVMHRFFPNEFPKYDEVYMIGDRSYDIAGARTFRIETIGVTYGYGSREELEEAKADHIVESVAELKRLLKQETDSPVQNVAGGTAGPQVRKEGSRALWKMILPLIMFFVAKSLVTSFAVVLIDILCAKIPALKDLLVITDEAAGVIALNGNGYAICQMIGIAASAALILKFARMDIAQAAEEAKEKYEEKEPVKCYVILGITALCAVIGMNLVLTLTGLTMEEEYQAVAMSQHAANLFWGILCYGVVAAVAEELVFRGIVYNCIKRNMKPNIAMLLSALVFSTYHGNTAQSLYAFVIGFLLAYAYEYFGSFYVPLAIHVGANVLVFVLTKAGINETAFVSIPVAAVTMVIAIAGFILLEKNKRILK